MNEGNESKFLWDLNDEVKHESETSTSKHLPIIECIGNDSTSHRGLKATSVDLSNDGIDISISVEFVHTSWKLWGKVL